jgi:hypothetical protein
MGYKDLWALKAILDEKLEKDVAPKQKVAFFQLTPGCPPIPIQLFEFVLLDLFVQRTSVNS